MTASLEVARIDRLAAAFPRSAQQLNGLHESDAELVRLADGSVLAATTDSIVEEIDAGLYDPEVAGWMAVAASASDLAAVGAQPLGVLLSETFPREARAGVIDAVQRGIRDAALAHGVAILGGDTNYAERLQLTATALGIVPDGRPMTRCGARPGDRLFATGLLGLGSAFAFARLSGGDDGFRPHARLAEGALVRRRATACMDTSDGVLATLHELGRLNGVGFRLHPVDALLHPAARHTAAAVELPPWAMLAGPHGEFELVYAVGPDAAGPLPGLELGDVTGEPGVRIGDRVIDAGAVRNLFEECHGTVRLYIERLRAMA